MGTIGKGGSGRTRSHAKYFACRRLELIDARDAREALDTRDASDETTLRSDWFLRTYLEDESESPMLSPRTKRPCELAVEGNAGEIGVVESKLFVLRW